MIRSRHPGCKECGCGPGRHQSGGVRVVAGCYNAPATSHPVRHARPLAATGDSGDSTMTPEEELAYDSYLEQKREPLLPPPVNSAAAPCFCMHDNFTAAV
jgi:hypothetical protein